MAKEKIKGRIIRILDKRTVVINLGSKHGISADSIFHILGDPEAVEDPETKVTLGTVRFSKSRVRASQVFDNFTIATTSWTTTYFRLGQLSQLLGTIGGQTTETGKIDEGDLDVNPKDIRPWKAKSESPVKVGDDVEVEVDITSDEELQLESGIHEQEEGGEQEGEGDEFTDGNQSFDES
jgi:hypothetical protein